MGARGAPVEALAEQRELGLVVAFDGVLLAQLAGVQLAGSRGHQQRILSQGDRNGMHTIGNAGAAVHLRRTQAGRAAWGMAPRRSGSAAARGAHAAGWSCALWEHQGGA